MLSLTAARKCWLWGTTVAKQQADELRRQRTWVAAQIASALIRTFGEDDPSDSAISQRAVRITDALLARLAATDPYGE